MSLIDHLTCCLVKTGMQHTALHLILSGGGALSVDGLFQRQQSGAAR